MKKTILSTAVVFLCAVAFAAAKDYRTVDGEVTAYDRDSDVISLTTKQGEELTLKSPREAICFYRRKGSVDELKDGLEAEVGGTLNEDQTAIRSTAMTFYPGKGRGGNQIIPNGKRADGKLKQKDGQWCVTVKDRDILIEMKPDCAITASENYKLADIKIGDKLGMWAMVIDDKIVGPTYINVMPAGE